MDDKAKWLEDAQKYQVRAKQLVLHLGPLWGQFMDVGRRIIPQLLDRGWYLSLAASVPLVLELRSLVRAEDWPSVDARMGDFARSRVDKAETAITARWPDRQHILQAAFQSHRDGSYDLSIPTMLAQADGLLCDLLLTDKFFRGRHEHVEKLVEMKLESVTLDSPTGPCPIPLSAAHSVLFEAFQHPNSLAVPVSARDEKRKNSPSYGPLNRNGVLHGVDLDYGTESNSLRCVLLLDWACGIAQGLDDQITTQRNLEALLETWVNSLKETGE